MVEENVSKIEELTGIDEEVLMEEYGPEAYLVIQKSRIYKDITKLTNELIESKSDEKSHLGDLWNCTIWEDVFTGKFTLDNKKAYIGEHIRPFKEHSEYIQAKIDAKWRDVDLINSLLKIGGIDD